MIGLGRASACLVLGATLAIGCSDSRASFLEYQSRYLTEHPGLDDSLRDAILHREVIVGMNQQQVRASLGEPMEIRREANGMENWLYSAERIRGYSLRMLKDRDLIVRLRFRAGVLRDIGEGP